MILDLTTPNFSDKERVIILFKEYDTLRAEIIARTKTQQGYLVVCASIIGFIIALGGKDLALSSTAKSSVELLGVASVFLLGGVTAAIMSARHTAVIGLYLREIELKINKIAGGEALMGWETFYRDPIT